MKIAICGGTGFIGSALVDYWLKAGHELIVITRQVPAKRNNLHYVTWRQIDDYPSLLEGIDALVNLAGASLNQRWTDTAKVNILQSRLHATNAVATLVQSLDNKPEVVIQGSAVGIYGTSESVIFDECSDTTSTDFLSEVTTKWEEASNNIIGTRLVKLRTGVVLGNEGGAYPLMKLPYLLGFGGKIGSGQQWISWIHLQDIVALIDFCVSNRNVAGPVNATSPNPVSNQEFGQTIGNVYHRPHWFPLPAFLLRTMLGSQSTLLLDGQRVLPATVLNAGFHFTYPTLTDALLQIKSEA